MRCTDMIKCVAWDLDNTIWMGVADDGGIVELRPKIIEILDMLNRGGIVNVVVSKNNREVVNDLIIKFGLEKFFFSTVANWKSKYSNIINICKELNISPNSVLLIDDSEFELQEAKYHLPDIKILNAERYLDIYELISDSRTCTKEGKARNYIYRILQRRNSDEKKFSGNKLNFLMECNIRLDFRDANYSDISRIFELANRTNQFNVNRRKIQEVDIIKYIDSEKHIVKVCQLKDRYANYGIVGMAIMEIQQDRLVISNFAVSCKIEGRGVGKAFLTYLLNQTLLYQYNILSSNCVFGDRNQEMRFLFSNLGFKQENSCKDLFTKHIQEPFAYDSWLNVREMDSSTVSKVRSILAELVPNMDEFGDYDDLIDKNIIDSITAISLISAIEEKFNIDVEFEELKMLNFSTISKIASFIEAKQTKGKRKNVL